MEHYVQNICSVPRLGSGGARQLAIDIEYVCNVLAALGVSPTEDLELVRQLVECELGSKLFMDVADGLEEANTRRIRRRLATTRDAKVPK
jgi:Golgi complex component 7 (COG7)